MTVCNFFLQGRCRYGDKCWNEHPQGGGGGGGYGGYSNRPPAQSGGNRGGYGNRVWVNPSQRSSGRDFIKSSAFPQGGGGGGGEWGRGGGGEERNDKGSGFGFPSQNRFSVLNAPSGGTAAHSHADDDDKYVETVCKDMESWVSSGQWPFSCYSPLKASLSGFTELSPEELRLEYCSSQAGGTLQNYVNTVQQLANQWRSRVQELTNLNSTTRAALIAELKNPPATSLGFSTAGSVFGAGFGADVSQAAVSTGFGSVVTSAGPTGFGSAPTAASFSFASSAPADSSLTAGSAPSAASFSFSGGSAPAAASFSFASSAFGAPPANKDAPAAFGAPAPEFGFAAAAGFGAPSATPLAAGGASFGQAVGGAGAPAVGGGPDQLFTPQGELTPEELKEFSGKRFTLGQVPLKPPPADLLVV